MRGGEIFIPKLPSLKIVDLVKYFDKKIEFKIIGKKPGEKSMKLYFQMMNLRMLLNIKIFIYLNQKLFLQQDIKKK